MVTEPTDANLWTPVFRVQCPESNAHRLKEAKERLLKQVLNRKSNPEQLDTKTPPIENQFKQRFSGHSIQTQVFISANQYPIGGRSTQGQTMPIFQFLPREFQAPLRQLGVHTLADYLLRSSQPNPRRELGALCGLSPTISLQLAWRAELLDLPITSPRANHFHTKEILLLGLLGLDSLPALVFLGKLLVDQPKLEPHFVTLVEALQKSGAHYVGKRRLTKHDIDAWKKNTTNIESCIEVNLNENDHSPTQIAEALLYHHLHGRLKSQETFWKLTLTLGLLNLRQFRNPMHSDLQSRLTQDLNNEDKEAIQFALDNYRSPSQAYADDQFAPYIYEDPDWSLLKDLTPQLRPETHSSENSYKFHLKPSLTLDALHHDSTMPDWLRSLDTRLQP